MVDAGGKIADMNLFISPNFADLYVSFLTSLLEASPKGQLDIYEFSAQYFENKLKERPGCSVKNAGQRNILQRDVPNSPGKKQFLPDFSYDSLLVLPPKVFSPFTPMPINEDSLLNIEKQVMHHLNDSTEHQQKNLAEKIQEFQENAGVIRLTPKDIDEYKHKITFLTDPEILKWESEEKRNVPLDKHSKIEKEQRNILDLKNLLKEETEEVLMGLMDPIEYRKNNFETLIENIDALDKVSVEKKMEEHLFQKCLCSVYPNNSFVSEEKKKVCQNEEQKDQFEIQNVPKLGQHQNKMKVRKIKTPKKSNTFIDAQLFNGSEAFNQIIEFSRLLPECFEVMGKMLNDLEKRNNNSKTGTNNSNFAPDQQKIHDCCHTTSEESCENDASKQNTSNKRFHTTSSQTDFARTLELPNANGSVLTKSMFKYVLDVVNAAKHLLYSVTAVKNYNDLSLEKIEEGMSSNVEFNEFQKILQFCIENMNKPENMPVRNEHGCIFKLLEKERSDNSRDPVENKNASQYESNEETKNDQANRNSNPNNHSLIKHFDHLSENQGTQNSNTYVCPPVQDEDCQERENYPRDAQNMRSTKKENPNGSKSNAFRSNKESLKYSSEENQKILDEISDRKTEHNNEDIPKSLTESVILSPYSIQDADQTELVNKILSKFDHFCDTNKDLFYYLRSTPILPIYEPFSKDLNETLKFIEHLLNNQSYRLTQESRSIKPKNFSARKTEYKEKEFFYLLEPRRSINRKVREKVKKPLVYYKIHDKKHTKNIQRNHDHAKKQSDFKSSSETEEGIEEPAQHSSSDSEQACPKSIDSTPFFISTPAITELIQNFPEPLEDAPKSTGDLLQKQGVQVSMKKGPRKRFWKKLLQKDKLQDIQENDSFSLLDPKRTLIDRKQTSDHKPMTAQAEIDDEDSSTKLIVHEIHQATSKLRRIYKEAASKTRTDQAKHDLDGKWRTVSVPITGRSWLRSYFTTRMIRRYQKQLETDKIDIEIKHLTTPVFKHQECCFGIRSYFSQRSLFSCVRIWYFSKKLREYQKGINS